MIRQPSTRDTATPRWQPGWWARPVLALHAALAISYAALWFVAAGPDWFPRADFTAFYAGWAIVRDGRAESLYDLAVQAAYQAALLPGYTFADGVLPYINPPHLTPPFVLLAWLPRPVAFTVWTLIEVGLLVWLVSWLWRRFAADWSARERGLMLTALLAFHPLLYGFLLGAFSLPLLVALAGLVDALERRRDGAAGGWLVLATLKPQVALGPAALLLATRHWRALATATLLGAASVVVATLLFGPTVWPQYLQLVQHHTLLFDRMGVHPGLMWNLRGALTLLLGAERAGLINLLGTLGLVAGTAATLWLWRGPWQPGGPAFDRRLALTLLLGLLTAPHLNSHDGLLYALPALLAYRAARTELRSRQIVGASLLACPTVLLLAEWTIGGSLGVRLPVVAALALAGWLAVAPRRPLDQPALAMAASAPPPEPMVVVALPNADHDGEHR